MVPRLAFMSTILVSAALAASTITGLSIAPPTITFSSPNPDVTPVNGNRAATITWTMSGNGNGNWSLTVQAPSSTLAGCPSVPVGAVQFQCTSLKAETGGSGNCASGSFPLSTTPQTVASGNKEGNSGSTVATVSFTFTDAWKYPASSSCSVQVTYTINAQ
jgi:hypothetical protein